MSNSTNHDLEGVDVAIFLAQEGTEEVEFTEPKQAVEDAGATVDVVGHETGEGQTVTNDLEESDAYEIETTFEDVSAEDYDGVIVPGGTVGADTLRTREAGVDLLRAHVEDGKPTAVICHGPWTLVEAGVVDGRTLTSYHSLQTDVRNAGGEWVDEEVVTDDGLITSRNPDDLDAFCETILEQFEAT
ncbi:type 1 glutamine amidotransferase domain-containing protein [Natronorubrum daqingense]|uniref:Protease n=1 Tax=Natronorubrum daqingense TaxID=588898 RepID=A0A1N7DW01_9EURY|nr:type 1 glutamine amidotransferase domain-containing protein [Natronorubrum daqingense]APX96210.1 protease [Natronorubrum daqingense]SIR79993.1 protease I [Natronorubrum daqingense]